MAKQVINVGTSANSGGGDPLRDALIKVNENFDELYARDLNTDAQTLTLVGNTLTISDGNSVDLSTYLDDTQFSGDYDDLTNKPTIPSFDQDLNTTDDVAFNTIEVAGSFINNSVSDGSGLQVETTSDFEIKVDTAIWSFEPNDGGRIEFPDGSTQTTAYTGVIPGYINTADLKTLVAASTDFDDFKTRIAALT